MSDAQSVRSGAEIDDQKRELLERIKNASNGPEHAKRRIEALDKMVKNLKTRRRVCGEAMTKDKNNMDWIDKELARLNKQYLPLCTRLKDREETLQNVKHNLELAEQTMLQIMKQTKTTTFSGMISNQQMVKKNASVHLKSERGFGVEPSTTFHQRRRRSITDHHK